jgi:hypothetical protein
MLRVHRSQMTESLLCLLLASQHPKYPALREEAIRIQRILLHSREGHH